MTIRVTPITGPDTRPLLPALSQLRLTVFREWPYLYEGDAVYEAEYLATFADAPDTVIVGAWDGDDLVGAATASPLAGHTDEFVPLFEARGFDPQAIFYCGESVLLPAYRGRGIGHAFFDHREAHARALNAAGARFTHVTFCGVMRDDDDPRRPAGYRPLDAFWEKRGYEKVDGLIGTYDWREVGDVDETTKRMQFWVRALD